MAIYFAEELVSSEGFSDDYSLIYHNYPPTRVLSIDEPYDVTPEIAVESEFAKSCI